MPIAGSGEGEAVQAEHGGDVVAKGLGRRSTEMVLEQKRLSQLSTAGDEGDDGCSGCQ